MPLLARHLFAAAGLRLEEEGWGNDIITLKIILEAV